MTDQEIRDDRNKRTEDCRAEIESTLRKYQFGLMAEDNWTPNTKIRVEISFVDLKKYDSLIAQEANPKVPVPAGGQTVAVPTQPLPEGPQPDGGVVISADSLN